MKKIISVLLSLLILFSAVCSTVMLYATAETEYVYWKQGDGNTFSHIINGGFSTNADKSVLYYDPATRNKLSYVCLWGDDAHKIADLDGKTFRLSMDITMINCVEENEGIGIVGSPNRGAGAEIWWPEHLYNIGWIGNGKTETICTTFTVSNMEYLNYLLFTCKSNSKFEIRNIVLSELVSNVKAESADPLTGTVAVENITQYYKGTTGWGSKNHYPFKADANEYAVGEKVRFTATPISGYEFEAWKDENGNVVSTSAVYETAIVGDTVLTAHFKGEAKYVVWKQGDGNTFSHLTNGGFSTNADKSVLYYDPATKNGLSHVCLWGDDAHKITSLVGKTFRLTMDITMIECVEENEGIGIVGSRDRGAASDVYWPEMLYNIGWIPEGETKTICTTFTVNNIGTANYFQLSCRSNSKFEIRNITLSELVGTVEANSNNPAFGSATVSNSTTYYKGTTGWGHKNHYPFKADANEYALGEAVTFTAIPNKGRQFVAWKNQNDEVVSTDAEYITTVEDDISLIAYFEKVNDAEFTVSVDVDNIAGVAKGGNVFVSDGNNTADSFTVLEGKELTLIAKPFEGYDFVGWFANGAPVATSTEANYTFKVDLDAIFTGVFKKSETADADALNLINDGKFSSTDPTTSGKIRMLNEKNAVDYEDGRNWFSFGGTANVIAEDGNKYVSMANSGYVMQTLRLLNNKEYVLQFKARSGDANGAVARFYSSAADEHNINAEPYGEVQYEAWSSTILGDGEWHSYSIKLTPKSLNSDELIMYFARTMAPMDIDDIALYEMNENTCAIGTTVFRGGSAEVNGPTFVKKGDSVTFVATPESGNTFLGWYVVGRSIEGFISTDATFTTAVTESTTLMAVFGGEKYADTTYGILNGGAEDGKTANWIENFIGEGSKLTVSDEVKHSGDSSFRVDFEGARQGVAPNDPILLKGKCKYTFSGWFYVDETVQQIVEIMPSISTTFPYRQGKTELVNLDIDLRKDMPISLYVSGDQSERIHYYSSFRIDPTNAAYWDAAKANGGWYEFKMSFSVPVTYDCTVAYFGLRANMKDSENPALYYIDDVTVTEEEIDYSTRRTDETYCDELYNELKIPETLPKGFEFKDNTLKVQAGAGALVIPVEAEYLNWYHLGYDSKTNESGSSYIGVTFSEPSGDFSNAEALGITAFDFKKSSDFIRDGFKYFSENEEQKAWIVIYGGSNEFALNDIFLFNGDYADTVNVNNIEPELYDYEGMGIVTDDYDLKWARFIEAYYGYGADSVSPSTGDKIPALAIIMLVAAFVSVTALSRKKEVRR